MSESILLSNFSAAAARFRDELEKTMNRAGLHSGQSAALAVLWKADGINPADIAREMKVSAPTVTLILRRLSEDGWINSERDPMDSRKTLISLTAKGRDVKESVEELRDLFEQEFFKCLTDTERLMLEMLLKKLNEDLLGRTND